MFSVISQITRRCMCGVWSFTNQPARNIFSRHQAAVTGQQSVMKIGQQGTTGSNKFLQLKTGSLLNYQDVRFKKRVYYKPSAWKRVYRHGLEVRLSTQGGKEILWRRLLKGKHNLTTFDQFVKPLPPMSKKQRKQEGLEGKQLPKRFYLHKTYQPNKY